jgi:beta-xylosidase
MTRSFRRLRAAAMCLLACAALAVVADRSVAGTTTETFAAGAPWHGMFSDPSVLKVGNTYWAYATVCCGANLPVTHSRDLNTWYARDAYPPDSNPGWWRGYNDALPHPAKWAVYNIQRNGRWFTAPWAPSVGYVGGHYVLAYSVPVSGNGRRCISMAASGSPQGQFFDNSSGPIVCSSDPKGSNDPQVYTDSSGAYLIWKNTGVPGSAPTKIWTRKLNASGTGFAAGSAAHFLLQTAQPWEGNVIENPAMIKYANRYYLFYSGNGYDSAAYATGYAICSGVYGPCHRVRSNALLASGAGVAGPGGATPFVGPSGALRLAYAAWDAGRVANGNPRRLHIARVTVDAHGLLGVASRG